MGMSFNMMRRSAFAKLVSTPDRVNLRISSSSITLIWGSILLVYNMSDCFYILIYFIYERFNFTRLRSDRPKVANGSASLILTSCPPSGA